MSETRIGPTGHGAETARAETAIAQAAHRTGIDFGFLLAQARIESGLDSHARARSSSATGLFQFIDQTWLQVLHRHGARHGLGQISGAIDMNGGRATIADPQQRSQILALRKDPAIAALMAGEFARDNRDHLIGVLGREPDGAELYLAHFLGAGGAARFLTALERAPGSAAADGFAEAAQANRAIFYASGGAARSYTEVMSLLRERLAGAQAQGTGLSPGAAGAGSIGGNSQAPLRRAGFTLPTLPDPLAGPRGGALPPVSALLAQGFTGRTGMDEDAPSQAADHARRAYARLQAFGL